MSVRTLKATTALAHSLGQAAWPASADGGRNSVAPGRWGAYSGVGFGQDGDRSRRSVRQDGDGDTPIEAQDGARNRTVIGRAGALNGAAVARAGRCNLLGVARFGPRYGAKMDRTRRCDAVGVIQTGEGETVTVTQDRRGSIPVIIPNRTPGARGGVAPVFVGGHVMTTRAPFLLTLTALVLTACALALRPPGEVRRAATGPEPQPFACVLLAEALPEGGTRLEGSLEAREPLTASYDLRVRGPGVSIDQGGTLSLEAGRSAALGQATVSTGLSALEARLTVTALGRTLPCPLEAP